MSRFEFCLCLLPARARPVLCLLLAVSGGPVHAFSDLTLKLESIEFQNFSIEDVSVAMHAGDGESVALVISAARVALDSAVLIEQLKVNCSEGQLSTSILSCEEGKYQAYHPEYGEISGRLAMHYRLDGRAAGLRLATVRIGMATVSGSVAYDTAGWTADLQGNALELSRLRAIAGAIGYRPVDLEEESGAVDVDITITGGAAGVETVQGMIKTKEVGFFAASAAEALSAEIKFDVREGNGWQMNLAGRVDSGAMFIDTGLSVGGIHPGIGLEITGAPLHITVDMHADPDLQRFDVRDFTVDHPGVMAVQAKIQAEMNTEPGIHSAEVDLSVRDAGEFYITYLQPFLLGTQFGNLEMAGAFEANGLINDSSLVRLAVQFADLHIYDSNDRFYLAGIDGGLQMTDTAAPVSSTLSWQGAGIYRLDLGAGRLVLESSRQTVNIVSWDDVPLLDGVLQINSLNITNAGRKDMVITLDGALTPVSMADFTAAMGWPVMSGELTTVIDGLSYRQGRLEVDGSINLGLFDGDVDIRNLRIDDLFGLVPSLYADIDIHAIDLELLTGRFDFGRIQGRISGRVHQLQLQAWQPVYFEAELATPDDYSGPRRISQQAVDNIGLVGGGAAGALSGGFLRLFREYSYGRIGISCRLYNGWCELGGVSETADGFVLVSRGGLLPPWIEVKATGHSIHWATLIETLKTVTQTGPN